MRDEFGVPRACTSIRCALTNIGRGGMVLLLIGAHGCFNTCAPLLADTSWWFVKQWGITVATRSPGRYRDPATLHSRRRNFVRVLPIFNIFRVNEPSIGTLCANQTTFQASPKWKVLMRVLKGLAGAE